MCCVEWRAPTPAGTSVFTKHNWDVEMGICGLMGGAFITGGAFMGLLGWTFMT